MSCVMYVDPQYMRKRNLTPSLAVQLNLHRLLLHAPKKRRQSYGPRSNKASLTKNDAVDDDSQEDIDAEELTKREETTRARNREHARATRRRRRIFKEIDTVLTKHLPASTLQFSR